MSGVICDTKVATRVNGKVYKMTTNSLCLGDSSTGQETGGRRFSFDMTEMD